MVNTCTIIFKLIIILCTRKKERQDQLHFLPAEGSQTLSLVYNRGNTHQSWIWHQSEQDQWQDVSDARMPTGVIRGVEGY